MRRIDPGDTLPEVVAAYVRGESAQRIAERFGVSKKLVCRWLAAEGVTMRGNGPPPSFDHAEALRLNEQGLSDAEIGRRLHAPNVSVGAWRKRMGIPLRRQCLDCDSVFVADRVNQARCLECWPALESGSRVGNFEVVEHRGYCNSNGELYAVRDVRCGHEAIVSHSYGRPFVGVRTLCGCPIRYVDYKGYAWWRWPSPTGRGTVRVPEHWIVWQGANRPLRPGEEIHHKNGDRDDNRLDNLELWVVKQPKGQRPEDLVEYAREILGQYDPDSLTTSNRSEPCAA